MKDVNLESRCLENSTGRINFAIRYKPPGMGSISSHKEVFTDKQTILSSDLPMLYNIQVKEIMIKYRLIINYEGV
jgi:hypothetical protein